jgi:bacillopeptidase F
MERSDKDLTTPWPLEQIGMDRVFSKDPSLNGEGVIIGSVDTGVDPNHESLRGKIISFFDTKRREVTFPVDRGGHGTHTIGTMIGGETDTLDRIGVAPAAKLVAAGSLGSVDDVFAGMEHMLDPDGNPDTDDFPRVINNSWGGTGKSLEVLYKAITAWEASGILAVFAAGNSGDGPMTVTKPSEHPSVLTVAALDRDGMVTDFSSRGPASFESRRLQKPDLSAPGKDVRSAIPGNKYAKYSGTSMAAPHVAGVAALLIQRFPSLNPRQLRGILVLSAKRKNELGELDSSATWNPAYGHGQVSAPDALNLAQRVNGGGTSPFELATPFLKSPFALKADQISAMDTVFSSKRALFSSVQGPAGSKNSFREAIQWQSPDQFFN